MRNTDKKSSRKIKLFPECKKKFEKAALDWIKCGVCGHFWLSHDIKNGICNKCEAKYKDIKDT